MAFGVLLAAFAMEIIDTTIVNVGVPAIQRGLHATAAQIDWIISAYPAALSLLLVVGGRLGDVVGYRTLFVGGVAGFTIASLLCGVAPDAGTLIGFRILQAVAAAAMTPQVLSLIQVLYSPAERIARLSLFGLVGGTAAIGGPILGGTLIGLDPLGLGWRSIFLINLLPGIAVAAMGLRLLPAGGSAASPKLDVAGIGLLGTATLLLLAAINLGRGTPISWRALLLATAIGIGALIWRHLHRRTRQGRAVLVPLRVCAQRCFVAGLLAMTGLNAATAGLLLLLSLTLQGSLHCTPLQTALVHIPFAVGMSCGIAIVGRILLVRLGPQAIQIGLACAAAGLAVFVPLILHAAPLPVIGAALLFVGLGLGTATGPVAPVALAPIDVADAGAASGLLKTGQQLGAAIGLAGLGSLYFALHPTPATDSNAAFVACVAAIVLVLAIVFGLLRSLGRPACIGGVA